MYFLPATPPPEGDAFGDFGDFDDDFVVGAGGDQPVSLYNGMTIVICDWKKWNRACEPECTLLLCRFGDICLPPHDGMWCRMTLYKASQR